MADLQLPSNPLLWKLVFTFMGFSNSLNSGETTQGLICLLI